MCNEIEYEMLEDYLAKLKNESKEKKHEKQVLEVAAT